MHNLDWDDLRILLAVADTGSQSAAASRLEINQTTISRRLRQLEQDYGKPLLLRQRYGYGFTDEADLLIAQARKMEHHALEIARAQVNADRKELLGKVVVSSTDMVLRYLIAPTLKTFRQRYPQLELVLLSEERVVSLSHMDADIALRYGSSEQVDLVQRRLLTFKYRYFASDDYLKQNPVNVQQSLSGQKLLKFEHKSYLYTSQQLQDLDNNEVVLRSNHIDMLINACLGGLGLLSLQEQFGEQISGLQKVMLSPHRESSLWIVSHKDNRHIPAIAAVADFIIEHSELLQ